METTLRKMGNSTGLILPKAVMHALGVETGAKMQMRVEDGCVIAEPVREKKVREGWEEAAALIGAEPLTKDEKAWLDMPNESDKDWTW